MKGYWLPGLLQNSTGKRKLFLEPVSAVFPIRQLGTVFWKTIVKDWASVLSNGAGIQVT